jgi:hypothetical protein
MKRSLRSSEARPSMFTFLSVLVCLLGSLMFIAIAITTTTLYQAKGNIKIKLIDDGTKKHTKEPIMLECSRDKAISTDGKYEVTIPSEHSNSMDISRQSFVNFLNTLDSKNYILFVIRADGIDTYQFLLDILRTKNKNSPHSFIDYGTELIPAGYKLKID